MLSPFARGHSVSRLESTGLKRFAVMALLALAVGCGKPSSESSGGGSGMSSATVAVDGSSTVYPITEAVAEEFQREHPNVRVTVGIAGTGGGFKRFLAGETDINDASRPILAEEADVAAKNGMQFVELPIAFDGLSVMVNPKNDF